MQNALMVNPDGTTVVVGADLKPLGDGDIDRRVLHVLPKLFVPAGLQREMRTVDVDLRIDATNGVDILPPGCKEHQIEIRQPYPNTRYFVAGSPTNRNGWVVPIPDGVYEFDIIMSWAFAHPWRWTPFTGDEYEVQHLIHVTLLPGDFRTYTMDSSNWPVLPNREKTGKAGRTAVSLLGIDGDSDPRVHSERDIVKYQAIQVPVPGLDDEWDQCGHFIEERLSIPPIPYEKAYSISAHSEEQLHEVKQVSQFSILQDQHNKNASAKFPAAVFLEAVKLAETVDFGKGSPYSGTMASAESHPALLLLSSNWDALRSDGNVRKCGYAMPWVRVRDDAEYWCGYYESPNASIGDFEPLSPACATVGDSVLLLFLASQTIDDYDDEIGYRVYSADGQDYSCVGITQEMLESGEYDEAWYSLEALSRFRTRFAEAYLAIQALADHQEFCSHDELPR